MKKRKLFRKFSILSPVLMTLLMSVQVQAVDDLSDITSDSQQRRGIVTITDMDGNSLTPPPMPRFEREEPVITIDHAQIAADLDASVQDSMNEAMEQIRIENEANLKASLDQSMQDMRDSFNIEIADEAPISRDIAEQALPVVADSSEEVVAIPETEIESDNQSIENVVNSILSEELGEEVIASQEVASEEVVSEEVVSEEVVSEEVASEEVASEEVASEEVASEEVVSEEVASEEVASEEVVSEDFISSLAIDAQTSLDTNLGSEEVVADQETEEITSDETVSIVIDADTSLEETEEIIADEATTEVTELESQVSDAAENADQLNDIAQAGDDLSDEEKEAVIDQINVDEENIDTLADAVEESEESEGLQAQLDEAKEKLAQARAALSESNEKLVQARTYFEQITCNQQTQISDLTSQIENMRTSMFADIQAMMMPMFMNMMAMMQDNQITQRMEQGLNPAHSSGNTVANSLGLNLLSLSDIYSATGGRGGITINNYSVGGSMFAGDYSNSLTNGSMPGRLGNAQGTLPFSFNFVPGGMNDGQRFGQMDGQNPAAVSHLVNRSGASAQGPMAPVQIPMAPVQMQAPVVAPQAPIAAPQTSAQLPQTSNMIE